MNESQYLAHIAHWRDRAADAERDYSELKALYEDLQKRAVKVANWYGHDLDAALGPHVPVSNQEREPS